MKSFLHKAGAFVRRDFFIATSYRFQFLFRLGVGIFMVGVFYFIARMVTSDAASAALEVYDTGYFSFVLVGIAAGGFVQTGLTGFAERLRTAMTEGSLEMMFVSPTRGLWVVALPSLWVFIFEGVRAAAILVFGAVALGGDIALRGLPAALLVVALTVFAYSALGIFAAAIIMIVKRGDPINWAFAHVSTLIAGAYFPVALLPGWLQSVADLLPMTYAFRALRMTLLTGAGLADVSYELLVLGAFSAVALPLSAALCSAAIARAKRDGSLGAF